MLTHSSLAESAAVCMMMAPCSLTAVAWGVMRRAGDAGGSGCFAFGGGTRAACDGVTHVLFGCRYVH